MSVDYSDEAISLSLDQIARLRNLCLSFGTAPLDPTANPEEIAPIV